MSVIVVRCVNLTVAASDSTRINPELIMEISGTARAGRPPGRRSLPLWLEEPEGHHQAAHRGVRLNGMRAPLDVEPLASRAEATTTRVESGVRRGKENLLPEAWASQPDASCRYVAGEKAATGFSPLSRRPQGYYKGPFAFVAEALLFS